MAADQELVAEELVQKTISPIRHLSERIQEVLAPPGHGLTDELTTQAKNNLYQFYRQAWPVMRPVTPYKDGWHIGCICEHLQALTYLQLHNLVINEPPRHGKSMALVAWFCWTWLREPGARWLQGTYANDLATRDTEECQRLLTSPWYQKRWGHVFKMTRATNTKTANDRQGYRIGATVGGKILGEGGNYLVFDDPHKAQDVYYQAKRQNVINTWTKTMATRGDDPALVRRLVVMQRLDEQDLSGYLASERNNYEHLVLPAEYEPKRYFLPLLPGGTPNPERKPRDAITPTALQQARPELLDPRTEENQPLWPEHYPAPRLEELKIELEGPGAAGQLQQRPAPAGGALFKEELFRSFSADLKEVVLQELHIPLSELRFFQVADTAITIKTTSAYTALTTCAYHRATKNLLVWHAFRAKLMPHEQLEAIRQLKAGMALWHPETRKWVIPGEIAPWPVPIAFQAVEEKATGPGLLYLAASEGYPLRGLKASEDKTLRAATALSMLHQGRIWFASAARWLPDFVDELLSYPMGAHADWVDCLSHSAILCAEDALLNLPLTGDIILYPRPVEENLPKEPVPGAPAPVGIQVSHPNDRTEIITYNGRRFVFNDDDVHDPTFWGR